MRTNPALAFRWGVQAALAIATALIVARTLCALLFPRRNGFLEALRFWFQPNWLSFLRGGIQEGFWATCKLFAVFIGAIGAGAGSLFVTTVLTAKLVQ